jgi:hypothetical protein
MGKGWSLYLAELYKNLFEEFEVRTTQFETTDSTLVSESCGIDGRRGRRLFI